MARTPTQTTAPAELIDVTPQAEQQLAVLQDGAIQDQEKADFMELGRKLGQMETAAFIGNISDGVLLASYESVKKSKAWKLLKNNKGEIFPNLEAFCSERLGFSARRLAQVQGNRDTLGIETFEQAERLGLRQRDYNAIKALPAPDQVFAAA